MGAKQSTHTKGPFIHVSPGSVDDSFMLDERLTKSWHGNSHHSPFCSSIKEDEELHLAVTPDNLSYIEEYRACPSPYEPRKPSDSSGGHALAKDAKVPRTPVSLSACLNIQDDAEQRGRASNSSASSALSAYTAYSQVSAQARSPAGPVLLMHPPMGAQVTCGMRPNPSAASSTEAKMQPVAVPDDKLAVKQKTARPVEKDKREKSASSRAVNPADSSTWTTRMLRNLPNDYSRQDLLDLLDLRGVQYDFIYLPIDWGKRANLGYAFVNLVCPAEAERLDSVLNGFTGWNVASEKVCEVVWGKPDQQSLRKNVERFRNSPVMHPDVPDEFKPLLFTLGKRSVFPAPTKRLRPPRGFQRKDKLAERTVLEDESDESP